MNLKNTVTAIFLTALFTGLFSCNEDKGNYDYKDINTVKIDTLYNLVYAIGDILRINPDLTFSQGESESDFSFSWYVMTNSDPQTWELLQENRNLEIEVGGLIGKPNVTYKIAYRIFNNKTQIPYIKTFTLSVISPLTRGYVALCELDNGFDIDMIALSSAGKLNLYKNILAMTNSELPREGVKPYDIVTYDDRFAPDPFEMSKNNPYSVFILTDQYTTRILPSDYSWKPSYNISNIIEKRSYLDLEYVQKGKPVVAQKMKIGFQATQSTVNACVSMYHKEPNGTGNWYLLNTYPLLSLYSVQMNRLRPAGEPRFEPSPYAAIGFSGDFGGVMYYDINKKVFMFCALSGSYYTTDIYYSEPIPEETGNQLFKFNDPNAGLLYMDEAQQGNYTNKNCYAILKLSDGSFKYIEFLSAGALAYMAGENSKQRVSVIPANSNIGNAKFFAKAPESPFLFYATNDNKVYKMDISSATAVYADITSTVLNESGYNEITLFKYALPEGRSVSNALSVGTYNTSLGKAEGGKLEFFRISNAASGELAVAQFPNEPAEDGYQINMSWKGMGRIVGLTYKAK
jgi:hypothetical protein